MDKKLKRVQLHYNDGTVEYISGEQVKAWIGANDACAGLMYSHRGETGYEDITWKRLR